MIDIAILGYGTVGSGVVEVLKKNGESIKKRCGDQLNVKYILDLKDFPGDPMEDAIVHDYNIILNDPEVQIVVEVMGGVEPAHTFVKEALLKGKSVCTSNKELVAEHGAKLLELSKEKGLNFLFEASVGGGIPIIRPLNQSLTADEIEEITGILNGTTNYILTKMSNEGSNFDTVLKEAQDMGYAERNPAADIEGHDSCRKIAILSSLAYGMQVDFEDIYTEGITNISDVDIKYAKALDASIKLLGTSKQIGDKVLAMVAPMMIKANHPLFSVNDVFNGIFVKGNYLVMLCFMEVEQVNFLQQVQLLLMLLMRQNIWEPIL
jgi:homoserine dehydrogenase